MVSRCPRHVTLFTLIGTNHRRATRRIRCAPDTPETACEPQGRQWALRPEVSHERCGPQANLGGPSRFTHGSFKRIGRYSSVLSGMGPPLGALNSQVFLRATSKTPGLYSGCCSAEYCGLFLQIWSRRLAHVRSWAHYGLRSDITRGPFRCQKATSITDGSLVRRGS